MPAIMVIKRINKKIISNIRSTATVAIPVEKGIFSFFIRMAGLAASPILPGSMQFNIKPVMRG